MNDGYLSSEDVAPRADDTKPPAKQRDSQLPRLDVTIEHDSYIAGQANVVRLLVSNPYDDEIRLLSVRTPQTSSFREFREDSPTSGNEGSSGPGSNLGGFRRFLSTLASGVVGVVSVSVGGVTVELPREHRQLVLHADPNSSIVFDQPVDEYSEVVIKAEEGGHVEVRRKPADDDGTGGATVSSGGKAKAIDLRPRSTIVVPVSVKTRQWLLFTPQRFGLNVEIFFEFKGDLRSQVITALMDIRPPLSSMIFGGVIGGFLGSLVASLSKADVDIGHIALHCLTSILMSAIAAVSLSRRGNTQAFVTVEDFFGAFFVGSLIGYGGVAYFERAILPPPGK